MQETAFGQKGGKRQGGAATVNAAVSPNNKKNNLLYVHDVKTQQKWLIDGGAVISIIPPTAAQRLKGTTATQLQAANGTPINCYGVKWMKINLPGRSIRFPITIADVSQPILGSDFLAQAYLAPNHRDHTLIDLKDFSVIKVESDNESQPIRISYVDQVSDPCYQLLDNQFSSLSNPSFRIKEVKHGVRHFIPTDGPPVQSKARKLAPDKLAVAKEELEKLVALGVCKRGKSNWSSPLLVTTKPCNSPCTCAKQHPCGGWRVCGDYRRLNNMTTTDRYPVRNLQDFNNELRGKKFFSKVDLLKGYHQIPVNEADIRKTAVITPFGLFVFPRCPFGLKNAGQDFQRLMDEILGDIPHIFVYLDDILIASTTLEEHLEDLKKVFTILEENGLVVNRKKCVLGKASLDFLGHAVDSDGIKPLPEKVEAIVATLPPANIKQLQRFHGMVNYYRRFVPSAAHHLCALFDALQGKPKKLDWTDKLQKSFDSIKKGLASATMLHHPDPNLPLSLTTDASDVAMGGVVEQRGPKGWEPLGFFSKKFTDSQKNWCPYDRELNAVHKSIRHFKHLLEGRAFTVYTDHQSLIPSLAKKTDAPTARQINQLSEIAEFSTDIRYLEGKSNFVADCLSRPNGPEEEEKSTKKTVVINNVEYDMPTIHPFRQDILKYVKKEDTPFESIHDDSFDFDELEERYEKLLKTNSKISSKKQPSSESTSNSSKTKPTKNVSFADVVTVSAIDHACQAADAQKRLQDAAKPHPQTQSEKFTKSSTAAAAHGQTRGLSPKSSDTMSCHPLGLPQTKLDAANPTGSSGCLLKPPKRISSVSSANGLTEDAEIRHGTLSKGPLQDSKQQKTPQTSLVDPMMTLVTKKNSKSHREAKQSLDAPLHPNELTKSDQILQASHSSLGLTHVTVGSAVEANPDPKQPVKSSKELPASKATPVVFPHCKNSREFEAFIMEMHDKPEQHDIILPNFDNPSSSAPQDANEIEVSIPQQKVQDLQAVVNAIDHYDLDLEDMARQQALDPDFQRLTNDAHTGLAFRKIRIGNSDLYVDVSNGPARPFVPLALRRRVFDIIHGLGHPGVARTKQAVKAKFVWPSIDADVAGWARRCLDCQRAKVNRHTVTPIGDFPVPHKRFSHINADLVSMPLSNGFNHLLTIVDRHSRWPVAVPVKDIAAETIIDALTHNWISVYGVPEIITTDRGSQFTSFLWNQLLQVWGIKHITTTAYHPEANGMVERLHRRLKESLMALGNSERHLWYWRLPMTMLALRTTVKADLHASPADLVYGEAISIPGQILPSTPLSDEDLLTQQRRTLSNLRVEVDRLQPVPTSRHRRPRVYVPDELDTCTHVFIRRGGVQPCLTTPYDGPYRVLQRTPNGFRIEFPGRGSDVIAKARLRPAITFQDDDQIPADSQRDEGDDDDDDVVPPSPPPPGRRPGWRTRRPQPSSRVTRSQRQPAATQPQSQPQPSTSNEPIRAARTRTEVPTPPSPSRSISTPVRSNEPVETFQAPSDNREPVVPTPTSADDPLGGHVPPDENLAACPCDPPSGPCGPAETFDPPRRRVQDALAAPPSQQQSNSRNNQGGVSYRNRVPSFSNPRPGHFSFRRRRPDVSALSEIIKGHLQS